MNTIGGVRSSFLASALSGSQIYPRQQTRPVVVHLPAYLVVPYRHELIDRFSFQYRELFLFV
jgi:hypothetical protein